MQTGSIDSTRLLKELDESWRVISKQETEAAGGVLRACSMTLLVVVDGSEDPQDLGEMLAEINHEFPSRTIVVRVADAADSGIEGRVLVQCWRPAGRRQQICCEQIELTASPAEAWSLPNVVMGLMVPDLPVVLLCRKATALPEGLLALAHKVILDSASAAEPGQALTKVAEFSHERRFAVADIAWTRITRWREILNQIFEGPSLRGRLSQVRSVNVTYAGPGLPASACYLAAWLSRGLPEEDSLSLTEVVDEFDCPPAVGRIRSVHLAGDSISVLVSRPPGTHVEVSIDGLRTKVLFPVQSAADLLREEISVTGRDRAFEETLAWIPQVLELAR